MSCNVFPILFCLWKLKTKQNIIFLKEIEPDAMESDLCSQDRDDHSPGTTSTPEPPEQTSSRSRPPKRKGHSSHSRDLSNEVLHSVNEHFKRPLLKEDRFDIFGKNVAVKLRDLPKDQRLIAEKIINDTLFQAEMGNLRHTEIQFREREFIRTTPTPTPSPSTYQPHQFNCAVSISPHSISLPENEESSYNYSSASSVQYNSDSQHSNEDSTTISRGICI